MWKILFKYMKYHSRGWNPLRRSLLLRVDLLFIENWKNVIQHNFLQCNKEWTEYLVFDRLDDLGSSLWYIWSSCSVLDTQTDCNKQVSATNGKVAANWHCRGMSVTHHFIFQGLGAQRMCPQAGAWPALSHPFPRLPHRDPERPQAAGLSPGTQGVTPGMK